MNLEGALELDSLIWGLIKQQKMPSICEIRDYNRSKYMTPERDKLTKYFADLRRVCDVEDTIIEWYDYAYIRNNSLLIHIKRHLDIDQFTDQFNVL